MMFAATLAGIAFGNAGVHIPHAMSYSVAGQVRHFRPEGYPCDEPICPHGIAVIVDAPSVFRAIAATCPERHLVAAQCLGADTEGASPEDAGQILANKLVAMMQATGMPNGIRAVGYDAQDIPALVEGAYQQQRLLQNAPLAVSEQLLTDYYQGALSYW